MHISHFCRMIVRFVVFTPNEYSTLMLPIQMNVCLAIIELKKIKQVTNNDDEIVLSTLVWWSRCFVRHLAQRIGR